MPLDLTCVTVCCRVQKEMICSFPYQSRKVLSTFKYPSPDGWQEVNADEVDTYWGATKLDEVLDPDRKAKMTASDEGAFC